MDDIRRHLHELQGLVEHLYRVLDIEKPTSGPEVSAKVRELAGSGNALAAIKQYRSETGCDLLTAKTVIEALPAI